jgi:small conductance mechanosensitive channel
MEDAWQIALDIIAKWGISVLGAIAILIAGRIVAGIGRTVVRRVMKKARSDESLIKFVGILIYYLIIIFAVIAALAKFGVQTASFVAVLGAAGFAIGFALQGSLSNFASGVMILAFRPFKVGDYVSAAGVAGSIKEIGLFATTLATPDNVKIIVPNGKIYGDTIQNYSAYDIRRVDWSIGIGYGSSIERAKQILHQILGGERRVLQDPASMIAVSELADSSVNLVMRAWVKKEDYWDVKFDLTRKVKEEFDKNDIEIPFPQQVVHHRNPPAA